MMALLILGTLALTGCGGDDGAAQKAAAAKYHCPMHPTYVSDRPGDCPICNMKLVLIKEGGTKAAATDTRPAPVSANSSTTNVTDYYCTMCPEVSSPAPGNCPECNMKLLPRPAEATGGEHAGHSAQASADLGRVTIQVSPEKRHLIGLTLSPVEKRDLTKSLRTVAVVQHDETRYARIAPRFAGWVRTLHINFTGAPVEKGEPLFTAYSPDLFSTENEYLVAWRAFRELKAGASPAQTNSALALVNAARLRLELFEIGDEEIKALEQRGTPSPEMLFRAPFSGHVLVKNAVEGRAFAAGDSLYEIADLSHVWLRASVYEYELPMVSVGQEAKVHLPNQAKSYAAKITFIYPHIDPQSRRGEVRLELENHDHALRPDMWANVELDVPYGERLAVPASAVIDTGKRFVAFVEGEDLHLEPREVRIGVRTSDHYEVLDGLQEGEQVVTRALFLVDSESQLKAAIAGMTSSGAAAGHQH